MLRIKKPVSYCLAIFAANRTAALAVSALVGTNLISAFLGAVGGLLVARFLAPAEAGAFRAYAIPLMYLNILHLGTPDGLLRQLPYYSGKSEPYKAEKLANSAAAWNILVAGTISTAFCVLAFYYLWIGNINAAAGWASQAMVCWGVFYSGYLSTTYRTSGKFVRLARIEFIQALAGFGLVFTLPLLRFYGLCVRTALPSVISLILLFAERPIRSSAKFDWPNLKEVISVGLPFFVWIYLGGPLWLATESFLILKLGGVAALGYFGIAVVIREGLSILPQSIHQVLLTRSVEQYSRHNDAGMINRTLCKITLISTCVMLVFAWVASLAIEILMPFLLPKYVAGLTIIKISLLFPVLQALSLPLNTLFATGRSWLYGRGVLIGVVVFAMCLPFLLSNGWGVEGVVVASLIGRGARILGAYVDILLLLRKDKGRERCRSQSENNE